MQNAFTRLVATPGARRAVPAVLALGWCAALPLDVATTRHLVANQTFTGVGILFLGPLGLLGGLPGWIANPLLLVGLIGARSPMPSRRLLLTLAAAIALLTASAVLWRQIPDDSGDNPIIALHAGYWLWMATMIAASGWLATLGLALPARTPTRRP